MVASIELSRDPAGRWLDAGPTGDLANMRFTGFDGEKAVVVDISISEWDLMQLAHSDIDSAIDALERLAETGLSRPSVRGFGRVVTVTLPRTYAVGNAARVA